MCIKRCGAAILLIIFSLCNPLSSVYAQTNMAMNEEPSMMEVENNIIVSQQGNSSRISLELKGVDILDVLKVLAKKSGLNIVAGKNVRGQVTLFLQDVDVWDALKIVLETSELAYEQKGDIIKVITENDYEAKYGKPYADKTVTEIIPLMNANATAISETLNQLKSTVGRIIIEEATNSLILIDTPDAIEAMKQALKSIDVSMQTRIFNLKYAVAEDIESKLSELVTPNVGVIKVDSRTNKVIVTDIARRIEQFTEIIQAFDAKPRQVLIEAKIIEVVLDDEYVLGIDWDVVFQRTKQSASTGSATSFGGFDIPSTLGANSSALPVFNINSTTDDFNAVIQALEGMGKTNTLSNPRVSVLNNEEATLSASTREPFVSQTVVQGDSTSTTADNVEFVDVGVTLSVTPTITEDNYILMQVKPEVSTSSESLELESGDGSGTSFTRTVVPIVTSQEVDTKVLVKSGTTLVIGGLIQNSAIAQHKKLPFLGDIPLIGSAFRNKSDSFSKTELVVFITPYILSPTQTSDELDKFYKPDGSPHEFNNMGGPGFEYYDASQRSQSYLHINDYPFWENDVSGLRNRKQIEDVSESYQLDKALEVQKAMNSLIDRPMISPQPIMAPAFKSVTPMILPEYDRLIKERFISAINSEPALKGLSGEVQVRAIISSNGYLKRIDAKSLNDSSRNSLIILAINNNAPYPPLPPEHQDDEYQIQCSLFF